MATERDGGEWWKKREAFKNYQIRTSANRYKVDHVGAVKNASALIGDRVAMTPAQVHMAASYQSWMQENGRLMLVMYKPDKFGEQDEPLSLEAVKAQRERAAKERRASNAGKKKREVNVHETDLSKQMLAAAAKVGGDDADELELASELLALATGSEVDVDVTDESRVRMVFLLPDKFANIAGPGVAEAVAAPPTPGPDDVVAFSLDDAAAASDAEPRPELPTAAPAAGPSQAWGTDGDAGAASPPPRVRKKKKQGGAAASKREMCSSGPPPLPGAAMRREIEQRRSQREEREIVVAVAQAAFPDMTFPTVIPPEERLLCRENSGRNNSSVPGRMSRAMTAYYWKLNLRWNFYKKPLIEVVPSVTIGPREIAADYPQLKSMGITHVLNMTQDVPNFHREKLVYCQVHVAESSDLTQTSAMKALLSGAALLGRVESIGGHTFVHDTDGLSRGAAAVIAYLMLNKKVRLRNAWEVIRVRSRNLHLSETWMFFLGLLEVQVFRSTSVHGLDEFDFFKLKRALSLINVRKRPPLSVFAAVADKKMFDREITNTGEDEGGAAGGSRWKRDF